MTDSIGPPIVLPLAPFDLPIASPLAPTSMGGQVPPSVVQAPSLLNGGGGRLEGISMEVKNITALSDETFVV